MGKSMRRAILFTVLAAMSLPAPAARRFTVEQLRKMLAARQAAHESDGDLATRLTSQELSQQLTRSRLNAFEAQLKPGPKASLALDLLADTSAFLDPPADELLQMSPPDADARQSMLSAAANFATVTIQHMPNFLADRVTRSFDDTPVLMTEATWVPPHTDLHLVGTFSQEITYRNGKEVINRAPVSTKAIKQADADPPGLSTHGEFGPVLGIVLGDSSKGNIAWSHWEQMPSGPAAVFDYEVSEAESHFTVNFCCVIRPLGQSGRDSSGEAGMTDRFSGTPGYRGKIYVDPASGAILRLSMEAEFNKQSPIKRASIAVEYGNVEIGGNSYICPVRSVATSLVRVVGGNADDLTIRRINDVTFSNYHHFGATVRVLDGAQAH